MLATFGRRVAAVMVTKLANAMHVVCLLNFTQAEKGDQCCSSPMPGQPHESVHCYMSCGGDRLIVLAKLWLMQPGSDSFVAFLAG